MDINWTEIIIGILAADIFAIVSLYANFLLSEKKSIWTVTIFNIILVGIGCTACFFIIPQSVLFFKQDNLAYFYETLLQKFPKVKISKDIFMIHRYLKLYLTPPRMLAKAMVIPSPKEQVILISFLPSILGVINIFIGVSVVQTFIVTHSFLVYYVIYWVIEIAYIYILSKIIEFFRP